MPRALIVSGFVLMAALACGGTGGPEAAPTAPVAAAPVPATAAYDPTQAGALAFAFSKWRVEWIGDSDKMTWTFLPGGKVSDAAWPNDVSTYTIEGSKIHIEYNSKFTIYEGEFVDPYTMGGTFTQPTGSHNGVWKAVRIE